MSDHAAEYPYKGVNIIVKYGNITKEKVDVIVNAANSALRGGGGVDGAIHDAGGAVILEECREIIKKIGSLEIGKTAVTSGGKLDVKWIIHTVGPVWLGGRSGESDYLRNSYLNSLIEAERLGALTIAFPSISTGVFGYPQIEAMVIAVNSVFEYIDNGGDKIKEIRFVVFNESYYNRYKEYLSDRISYI